jgi:UDP-N-acetyl-D-mannosaminuronic acid dehydrogenase
MRYKNICILGLGYIGLPTAAVLASRKINVSGVDINESTVKIINEGSIHISEPGLEELVSNVVEEGYLSAFIKPQQADAYIIAVPTPFKDAKEEGSIPEPDLSLVESATRSIAPVLKKGDLIILESTSPIGTTEQLSKWLSEERKDLKFPNKLSDEADIMIAYCPERVLPGSILKEIVANNRIIGGLNKQSSNCAKLLYEQFVAGICEITDSRTAEMIKLTENSFRDVNIAFANELSILCDSNGVNVWDLIKLANLHPRVNILNPGPGVGGHCIAVDPWFIISQAPELSQLMYTARQINDNKMAWVINKALDMIDYLALKEAKKVKEITIACYGLTFKADIDDLRESPALKISQKLSSLHEGRVLLVEPNIKFNPIKEGDSSLVSHPEAIKKADIHLLLVDHKEFKSISPSRGEIIDTRGLWS